MGSFNLFIDSYLCPIILPLAIELMSGAIYGLIACELSHVGNCVEPGDITLFLNGLVSNSSASVCEINTRGTIISTNSLNLSVWIYLDARRIKYWDGFPIGICINRHFFGRRCTQRIQNCPNILVDLQTFRHRWFAVKWKYEKLILHITIKVIFSMDLPAHRTSPTRSTSIAIQL